MVFSAALHATTTTGVSPKPEGEKVEVKEYPVVDLQPLPASTHLNNDKSNVWEYTTRNAAFIGLAGLVAGLQEAYYSFHTMPPEITRRTFTQASILSRIVGRKTLLGATLGAAYCYTEATLENLRHKHDSWNGIGGGLLAGLIFASFPPKPLPQPIAWPLLFASVSVAADVMGEWVPAAMKGFKHWGQHPVRPNWDDPEPPRPPILETGSSARPYLRNFWRES